MLNGLSSIFLKKRTLVLSAFFFILSYNNTVILERGYFEISMGSFSHFKAEHLHSTGLCELGFSQTYSCDPNKSTGLILSAQGGSSRFKKLINAEIYFQNVAEFQKTCSGCFEHMRNGVSKI